MTNSKIRRAKKSFRKNAIEIKIYAFSDGRVEVEGFPHDFNAAINILLAAVKKLTSFFLHNAMQGNVTEKEELEPTRIILPH